MYARKKRREVHGMTHMVLEAFVFFSASLRNQMGNLFRIKGEKNGAQIVVMVIPTHSKWFLPPFTNCLQ